MIMESMDWNWLPISIALMAFFGLGYFFGFGEGVKKERKEASEWNEKIKREEAIKRSRE